MARNAGNKYLEGIRCHKGYEYIKLQGVLNVTLAPKKCPIIGEQVVVMFLAYLLQFFIVPFFNRIRHSTDQ